MMRRFFLAAIFLFFTFLSMGQIGVGEWRSHLPYAHAIDIAYTGKRVYAATEQALFYYDLNTRSLDKLTKVNALSDIGISAIGYDGLTENLLVAYNNGNIDLLKDNNIYNLSDIKRKPLVGDKTIYDVRFFDGEAWLSCGFGIVVVNVENREIKDSYFIGDLGTQIRVYEVTRDDTYYYAATDEGLFRAPVEGVNLADYSNWELLTAVPDYAGSFSGITMYNSSLVAVRTYEDGPDRVFRKNEASWSVLRSDLTDVNKINVSLNQLYILSSQGLFIYNEDFNLIDEIIAYNDPEINPMNIINDAAGNLWIADELNGLLKVDNGFDFYIPNGPYTEDAFDVAAVNDKIFVAAGGLTPALNNVFLPGMVFVFEEEQWGSIFNYDVSDILQITIDPLDPQHFYASTWGNGLLEYQDGELLTVYDENTSNLQSIYPGSNFVRISATAMDEKGNLWIANSQVTDPLAMLAEDGNLETYYMDGIASNLITGEVLVTEADHKWLLLREGGGILVFNDNGTPFNKNDDNFRRFSLIDGEGTLISNDVYCIAEDIDGEIWVGTNTGIVVYSRPENVFSGEDFYAQRILVTIGDYTNYLLESQTVTSIAVDGANRKWIGTAGTGVYLVSEDGQEEVYHFTAENSPLLSNKINNIAIDNGSGEVFFATDKGLISYRGSATMGNDDFRDVYVYPNPVRPDYSGEITVRGLVADAIVKITDLSGNLVYETKAEGGQATWNGKNFSGDRAASGVYLVFCTNSDGSKTHITKFLMLK